MSTVTRITSLISVLFIFLSLSFIYVFFSDIQQLIIIRVDTYRNLTFLGSRVDVLKVSVIGLMLVLFNILIVRFLEKKYLFEARFLAFGNILFAILILVVISGIILVN